MKTVYLALFIDGDNSLDSLNIFFDSEACLYANDTKIFERKENALQYLKNEIIKHYNNEEECTDELNEMIKAINEEGFYQDAELDTYILIEKELN